MRKQQRGITNHQREISNNAINDVKQISLSHVITKGKRLTFMSFLVNETECFIGGAMVSLTTFRYIS